jgi:hypothetical protein
MAEDIEDTEGTEGVADNENKVLGETEKAKRTEDI